MVKEPLEELLGIRALSLAECRFQSLIESLPKLLQFGFLYHKMLIVKVLNNDVVAFRVDFHNYSFNRRVAFDKNT